MAPQFKIKIPLPSLPISVCRLALPPPKDTLWAEIKLENRGIPACCFPLRTVLSLNSLLLFPASNLILNIYSIRQSSHHPVYFSSRLAARLYNFPSRLSFETGIYLAKVAFLSLDPLRGQCLNFGIYFALVTTTGLNFLNSGPWREETRTYFVQ